MCFLYILETNQLLVTSFVIIVSHSDGCLSISFIDSFACQKLLSFRSHFFIFVFISINPGGESEGILLSFMSKSILRMFFTESIIKFFSVLSAS